MKTVKLTSTGKIVEVENGLAHGMIERGEAIVVSKEVEKPKKNKMMAKDRVKLRTK
jgi:hypothetical protein